MDPETLSYDYFSPEPSGYGTPIDWYTDDLWALHKLMRLAVAVEALEPLREGAAAEHPEPMFASYEEMKAAAPPDEDPAETFYWPSWLWRATDEVHASGH